MKTIVFTILAMFGLADSSCISDCSDLKNENITEYSRCLETCCRSQVAEFSYFYMAMSVLILATIGYCMGSRFALRRNHYDVVSPSSY